MKYSIILITIIIVLLSVNVSNSYAAQKQNLLIYNFRNLVQDTKGRNIDYKIPVFLYDQIKGNKKNRYRVYFIENNKNLNRSNNINYIYNLAREKNINLVLYGYYSLRNNQLKIFPKILLVDRNLIIDVDKFYPIINASIEKAKRMSYYALRKYKNKKKLKILHVDYKETEKIKTEETKGEKIFNNPHSIEISIYGGPMFPIDSWHTLYSTGFFTNIDLSVLSTRSFFPVSLTLQTRYSAFKGTDNSEYVNSDLYMYFLGIGIDYNIHFRKLLDSIRFSMSGGFNRTLLSIDNKNFESIDPCANISLNMIFKVTEILKLKLGVSGIMVSYIDNPFIGLNISIGYILRK